MTEPTPLDPVAQLRAIMDKPEAVTLPPEMAGDVPPDADAASLGDLPPEDSYGDLGGRDYDPGDLGPVPPDAPPEEVCARFPLNDFGNGMRFVTHHGRNVLWVPRVGWHVWTGKLWQRDPDAIAVRRYAQGIGALIAKETAYLRRSIADELALAEADRAREVVEELEAIPKKDRSPEQLDALAFAKAAVAEGMEVVSRVKSSIGQRLTHAKNAGNSNAMSNMITEAGVSLARDLTAMDAAPLDINTQTGVLRFSVTGGPGQGYSRTAQMELLRHLRNDGDNRDCLMTKIMEVDYDPDARSPLFDANLARVQPDPEMRAFLQRWLGLGLTALTRDQKMVFMHGMGQNMKSVLVELIARMMGGYAAKAKIESLTGRNKRSGGDATPDLVPLMGARMVRASEPEEGERLQEGMIKELTGGEKFMVRALHTDFVEADPRFKLTILGNHKPEIRGTDDGIWRRVLLVPFDVKIPDDEVDSELPEKLWAERSGILNWLLAGLSDYLEAGLQIPTKVLDATAEFRAESDPTGAFLESCCVVSGDARDVITSKDLGEAMQYWQVQQGGQSWGMATISKRLKDKAKRWRSPSTGQGFTARKASIMKYEGIRYTDVFGSDWNNLPRDATGRIIHSRSTQAAPPFAEGFDE